MKSFVLVAALMLSACATAGTLGTDPSPEDGLSRLAAFTINDLQDADKQAVAAGDDIAHLCYPALIQFITERQGDTGTVSGAFSAFQRARNVANRVDAGLPQYLLIGCAPLFTDARLMLAKMALVGR